VHQLGATCHFDRGLCKASLDWSSAPVPLKSVRNLVETQMWHDSKASVETPGTECLKIHCPFSLLVHKNLNSLLLSFQPMIPLCRTRVYRSSQILSRTLLLSARSRSFIIANPTASSSNRSISSPFTASIRRFLNTTDSRIRYFATISEASS
jgi:hypothetical protein